MKNDELLHKFINGTLNAAEKAEFRQRPEYAALAKIYKNTEHLAAPEIDEQAMLAQILAQPKAKIRQFNARRRWLQIAAAAAILLAAFVFLLPDNQTVTFQTAVAETTKGRLPDGSTFVLNAASELQYDAANWEEERLVHLKGEAFFSVEKGAKFKVLATTGHVEVLGTKFNVKSRNNSLEVTCQEGEVAVSNLTFMPLVVLKKGDAVRLKKGELDEKWTFQSNEKAEWLNGIFRFKKVPLAEVLEELERQFAIKIEAKDIDVQQITNCNFQNKDLELALQTALGQFDLEYRLEEKKVVLLKK